MNSMKLKINKEKFMCTAINQGPAHNSLATSMEPFPLAYMYYMQISPKLKNLKRVKLVERERKKIESKKNTAAKNKERLMFLCI